MSGPLRRCCRKRLALAGANSADVQNAASGTPEAAIPDLFVQVHIPKCAGTTVYRWLMRSHPQQHRSVYLNAPPTVILDDRNLLRLGAADPQLRSFSSHYIRTFEPIRLGRHMRYFTFLRDPIDHFLSYHAYMRTAFANYTDPISRSSIPPDCDRRSSRELAGWLLDHPQEVPFRENYQTNYLTSVAWRLATGIGPRPTLAFDTWEPAAWEAFRRDRLALAKRTLRAFFCVGVVERMDDSLRVLARRLARAGVPVLPVETVEKENVTDAPRDDASWIREDDPIGRRFLASIREDRELHAYALTLLAEALG